MDSGNRCQPDQYFRRVRPSLLVGMARIVRSQILILKEQEYVTAARALGASNGRIIKKHLLTNCIGTLIVTTTLQIPSSIFTESFLSFLGLGVAAPMPSLGTCQCCVKWSAVLSAPSVCTCACDFRHYFKL